MWWDQLPASAVFCDVETTGLGNHDRIVSFGAIGMISRKQAKERPDLEYLYLVFDPGAGQHGFPHADFADGASGTNLDLAVKNLSQQGDGVFCALWAAFPIARLTRLKAMVFRGPAIADPVARARARSRPTLLRSTNTPGNAPNHGAPRVLLRSAATSSKVSPVPLRTASRLL
jgi:hypothetical protein